MEIMSLQTKIHLENRLYVDLSPSNTANVDGSWTEFNPIGTVINYDVCGFYLFASYSNANADFWVDIGVSTDGTNITEILSDFRIHKDAGYQVFKTYIPLEIPRGYKLYGRVKTNLNDYTDYISCSIYPVYKPFLSMSYSVYKRYDVRVNTDNFATIYEVVNPVPFNVKYIIICISLAQIQTSPLAMTLIFNLYLGQSGSEQIIYSLQNRVSSTTDEISPNLLSLPIYIPKGERLAISHDSTYSTQSIFDYSIYLFG